MAHPETIVFKIAQAKERLEGLKRLPIKSDVDLNLIADLRVYIMDLFEELGEVTREQAIDRKFSGGEER